MRFHEMAFKNKNPSNAVINGIAAKHNKVTVAEVLLFNK